MPNMSLVRAIIAYGRSLSWWLLIILSAVAGGGVALYLETTYGPNLSTKLLAVNFAGPMRAAPVFAWAVWLTLPLVGVLATTPVVYPPVATERLMALRTPGLSATWCAKFFTVFGASVVYDFLAMVAATGITYLFGTNFGSIGAGITLWSLGSLIIATLSAQMLLFLMRALHVDRSWAMMLTYGGVIVMGFITDHFIPMAYYLPPWSGWRVVGIGHVGIVATFGVFSLGLGFAASWFLYILGDY